MPSIKDLKKRITSVNNTRQTTRAMKLVSAAKLRRAQDAILAHRPYSRQLQRIAKSLLRSIPESQHPMVLRAPTVAEGRKPILRLVVVSSDRGLCGSFNANVIKGAKRWYAQNQANYERIEWILLGRKATEAYKNDRAVEVLDSSEIGGKVTFAKARSIADATVTDFLDGKIQEVKVVYNEFKNAITQQLTVETFLPFTGFETAVTGKEAALKEEEIEPITRPGAGILLSELMQQYFAIQMYRILLESQASEHGARMSAMENATKNAGEMIKKLTLQYNKQRQAGITKELLEIISGSESQKTAS